MAEWFENWFDSEYYHLLYKKRNPKEAKFFIDNLLKLLKPKKNSFFLDLGCGTGRHSIYLNQKGYKVNGFDLSNYSLNIAKNYENKNLKFINKDMRFIQENNKYNFILSLFTSFGYFKFKKDNKLVIRGISKALKNNGIFVLDFLNISNCLDKLINKEQKKIKSITFDITKWNTKKYLFKKIDIKKKKEIKTYTERIQILTKEHIIQMCAKENLKLINSFGNYHLNKFNEKSERLILIFKKIIN